MLTYIDMGHGCPLRNLLQKCDGSGKRKELGDYSEKKENEGEGKMMYWYYFLLS